MEFKTKRYTTETFEAYLALPENANRRFELIGGEIIEKMVSQSDCSEIAGNIIFQIKLYLYQHKKGGRVTSPDGGYQIVGERYMPDVAYTAEARVTPDSYHETYVSEPPDLVAEVISPSDRNRMITTKVSNYLAANVVVWLVYPDVQEIHVHAPDQPVTIYDQDSHLNGGDVLPGFSVPVRQFFPQTSG